MKDAASKPLFVRQLAASLFVCSVSVGVAPGCSGSTPSLAVPPDSPGGDLASNGGAPSHTAAPSRSAAPGKLATGVPRLDATAAPEGPAPPPAPAHPAIDLDDPTPGDAAVDAAVEAHQRAANAPREEPYDIAVGAGRATVVLAGARGASSGQPAPSKRRPPTLATTGPITCDFPKAAGLPDQAQVYITVGVDPSGAVLETSTSTASTPGFGDAAARCVRSKMRFQPGIGPQGQPWNEAVRLRISFER